MSHPTPHTTTLPPATERRAAIDLRFPDPLTPRVQITGALCGSLDVREIARPGGVQRLSDGVLIHFDGGFVGLIGVDPEETRALIEERQERVAAAARLAAIERGDAGAAAGEEEKEEGGAGADHCSDVGNMVGGRGGGALVVPFDVLRQRSERVAPPSPPEAGGVMPGLGRVVGEGDEAGEITDFFAAARAAAERALARTPDDTDPDGGHC